MDSNYEWQKFRANERAQARLQEAETHRLAKLGDNGHFGCAQCRRLPFARQIFAAIKTTLSALMRVLRNDVSRTRSAVDEVEKRERLV